ncbi:MAG: DNA-directed RNA polymerase subunit beta, partial [Chlamydiota bacterium]|nr:DNA-directed RNA polymerase subunit beta [Chlamydiota bacterium]
LIQNQCQIGFSKMEKIIRDRINSFDFSADTLTPGKLVSSKGLSLVLNDFFGRSPLSQFMEQTNPAAELTHKRRLSSLGPGGLNRERAGFEVRDVHSSHYGRICPIETPEGPNIGLITSLSSFAKLNDFGFIETPYLIVREGVVTHEVEYMTADQEEKCIIAESSASLDEENMFIEEIVWARHFGEPLKVSPHQITHIDVSSQQMVSIVTSLIPFLEHDDPTRALMGSNMQRQAVPLLEPEAPIVGTGVESRIAKDSGAVVVAEESGTVCTVDGFHIGVLGKNSQEVTHYPLKKFIRSNTGTNINQTPICLPGDVVRAGDVLADGPAIDQGEVALGKNVLVAFMPWCGYNYEDAIIISEKLLRKDTFTSIYIEEFEATARETKLGREEITADIPNVAEEDLLRLGPDGVIIPGSPVKARDLLVGKITPKSETELTPEDKLLRAIFGEKAADVKDDSLRMPAGSGNEGVVMSVKSFSKKHRLSRSEDELIEESRELQVLKVEYADKMEEALMLFNNNLSALLLGSSFPVNLSFLKDGKPLLKEGQVVDESALDAIAEATADSIVFPADNAICKQIRSIMIEHEEHQKQLAIEHQKSLEKVRKGDVELNSGVVRQVKVYVATKRKLEVGDKMAGRHGNKGVISQIVPEYDMPYLDNGETIEIILNPLGVPSRMNIGQLLETHTGLVAKKKGIYVKSPIFQGFPEKRIWEMMEECGYPSDGKLFLTDGMTGERFDHPTVVGQIYMMKLSHNVVDKIHARSTGPYSLVTKQPLGGKSQLGGQRFGEMEVWALEAYGASNTLLEMLTVKSDDIDGRALIYESIVKGTNSLKSGETESFNVLKKEIQGLGIHMNIKDDQEASSPIFESEDIQVKI